MKKTTKKHLWLILAACLLMVPVSAMAATKEDAAVTVAAQTEADVAEEVSAEQETGEELDAQQATEVTDPAEEEISDGIHKAGGKRYYYKNNELQYGLQTVKVDGVKYIYYFGEDGAAVTGLQTIDGKTYYFRYSGRAFTGGYLEYVDNGETCRSWFGKDGVAVTSQYKVVKTRHAADDQYVISDITDGDTYRYYFDENGQAFTQGLLKYTDGGVIYRSWFGTDGNAYTQGYKAVKTTHEVVNGKITDTTDGNVHRYYFRTNGKAYTKGFLQFVYNGGTYRYYFRTTGDALTAAYKGVKTRFSADENGKLTDISSSKTVYYYFNKTGNAFTKGFLQYTDDGNTCYSFFQSNGTAMVGYKPVYTKYTADSTGTVTKNSSTALKKYYFKSNGKAFTGGFLQFIHTDSKTYRYYFQADGTAYTKGLKALSIRHSADANGKVTSISDGTTYRYYFTTSGNAYHAGFLTFIHTTGTKYNMYFQTDGTAFCSGSKTVQKRMSADKSGTMTDISDGTSYLYTFNAKGYGSLSKGGWVKNGSTWSYYNANGTATFTSNAMHTAWTKIKDKSSGTKYYVVVDTNACECYTFIGSANNWKPYKKWKCSPGKPSSKTVRGTFTVSGRGYSFGTSTYTCYYYTQFYGNYLFHSTLYHAGTFKSLDGRLGQQLSHGCVRLSLANAKWFYENLGNGSKVLIYGY